MLLAPETVWPAPVALWMGRSQPIYPQMSLGPRQRPTASHSRTLGGSCSFLPRPSALDPQFRLRPPDHPGVLGQGSARSWVTD